MKLFSTPEMERYHHQQQQQNHQDLHQPTLNDLCWEEAGYKQPL